MKTATTTATATVIKQQSLNPNDSASSLSETNLQQILDDTEFELERIMFEEFAKGLPSDIPMADF